MNNKTYTATLGAGLGMIDETKTLLEIWKAEESSNELYKKALHSGRFPGVSARRLKNLVGMGFSARMLVDEAYPARFLKTVGSSLPSRSVDQLLLVYTCRANAILADFVQEIYWPAYASGRDTLSNQDARVFVEEANRKGMTSQPWSESTVRRVASYLSGACADFGLLEQTRTGKRKMLAFQLLPETAIALAYDLHFEGMGDNAILVSNDWGLFGLDRSDVLTELKSLAPRGLFIIQTAGDVVRIGWKCRDEGELANAIAEG